MVQNKQKSNKINIMTLITCFMLIMVFVFGCVQYAFAADEVKWWRTADLKYGDDVLNLFKSNNSSYDKYTVVAWIVGSDNSYATTLVISDLDTTKRIALYENNSSSRWNFGILGEQNTFVNNDLHNLARLSSELKDDYYDNVNGSGSNYGSITLDNSQALWTSVSAHTYGANYPVFKNKEDCQNYINTGDMSNAVYVPQKVSVYDESIPTPKNLEVYFDRKLNKPFNLADLCNPLKIKWTIPESENYSDFTLDVQIDVNYNKLNSISGIGTKPTVLQTGKIEFASCSATDKELNISATYDGWTKLSEKYQTSIWGLTGNYFDIWLRYKDSSGNYGNWVKVTINPNNSSTVIKSGLFDNGTNTTINKGYEEISGDNGEHVSGDYDNYYVNTVDDNISNNLTSLKNNYSNLVSFFKELFGFLPAEIWIILIGLVSTMVLIAIVKFVRG